MATFDVAFHFMMDHEDPARKYETVPDAPAGAHAISGINSAAYPEDFALINALPIVERGKAVADFYCSNFWNSWYVQLRSDAVAKRIFDCAVNCGGGTACRLLQLAVNEVRGSSLDVDACWGPGTVLGANACVPEALIEAFQHQRKMRYMLIVKKHPETQRYLDQWLARAGD